MRGRHIISRKCQTFWSLHPLHADFGGWACVIEFGLICQQQNRSPGDSAHHRHVLFFCGKVRREICTRMISYFAESEDSANGSSETFIIRNFSRVYASVTQPVKERSKLVKRKGLELITFTSSSLSLVLLGRVNICY